MALTSSQSRDFERLLTLLGEKLEERPAEKNLSSLKQLLLIARDERGEEDEVSRLLNRYSLQPVQDITKGVTRACRRVCKIDNGGGPATGILVGPDLVLTAAHAMHGATTDFPSPDAVSVIFDEFTFADGEEHSLPCKVQTTPSGQQMRIVAASGDDELDYVIFRLESPIGLNRLGTSLRRRRGWMDLSTVNVAPSGRVIVLQHPGGKLMKVSEGIVVEDTTGVPPGRFRYDTVAELGSSGSAVLNEARQLVGLHVNETGHVEELVSFTAIFRDLLEKNVRLPPYPPPKSFTEAFLQMMVAPQDGQAFT